MSRKIVVEALWRVTLWGVDDKVTRVRRRTHAAPGEGLGLVTFRGRLLLFGYPLLEVATAYAVALWLGWGWMLLLLLAGIPVGFAIMRNAGDAAHASTCSGRRRPVSEPDAGRHALTFVGGLLIMIPGFWTDLARPAPGAAADAATVPAPLAHLARRRGSRRCGCRGCTTRAATSSRGPSSEATGPGKTRRRRSRRRSPRRS